MDNETALRFSGLLMTMGATAQTKPNQQIREGSPLPLIPPSSCFGLQGTDISESRSACNKKMIDGSPFKLSSIAIPS
jgi:hypothetical protein